MNNNLKNTKRKHSRNSMQKRICSITLALVILFSGIPANMLDGILNIDFGMLKTVLAANKDHYTPLENDITSGYDDGIYRITTAAYLEEYSLAYISFPSNHQADKVQILIGEDDTSQVAADFIALGTKKYPFKGKIIVSSGSENLIRIPEAFFDYVSDSAQIVVSDADNADPAYLTLARITNNTNEPMLARNVVHDSSKTAGWTGNEWMVQIKKYSSGTDTPKSYNYAGIIGTMEKGAIVTIDVKDGTSAEIKGDSDLGRICGSMGRNTSLTINTISGITLGETTETNSGYSITTTGGNAGGLVGSMDDKSVLNIKCRPENPSAPISSGDGYAGGIVGKNDGGMVILDETVFASTPYSYNGTITGTTGSGGLFGYFRPLIDNPETEAEETEVNIDLSKYNIAATLNGAGNIGGLFGELENKSLSITDAVVDPDTMEVTTPESRSDAKGGTIKITPATQKTYTFTHGSGKTFNIGGVAGAYSAYGLNDEALIISNLAVTTNNNNSAVYNNYGGLIGLIGTTDDDGTETAKTAYVKISDVSVTSTGCVSRYYGGLIGKGDKAFIDASGVTIDANNFKGGAIVGCIAQGVLKLSGTIDLSDATPRETGLDSSRDGQIVGYRDDALVYYDGVVSNNLSVSDRKVDNIGTWGDILVLDGTKLKKSDVLSENMSTHTITMVVPVSAITSVASFATRSLSMQISYSNNPIITNSTVSAPSTITFGSTGSASSIDLSGTGLRGLTRDNKTIDDDKNLSFTGSIVGNNSTIKLDIENIGGKPVYRHAYNGLLGKANSVSIKEITFDGKMDLEPCVDMYAGMAAATSSTSFSADTIIISTNANFTTNYYKDASDNEWGTNKLYLGKLVGNVSGNFTDLAGNYQGTVSGNAKSEDSCYGGVIGRIAGKTTTSFSGSTVSGVVANSGSNKVQKIGGMIAVIEKDTAGESRLNLDNVNISDLTVRGNASESCGGLLGYGWYNTNVQGTDVNTGTPAAPVMTESGMVVTVSGTNKVSVNDGETTPAIKAGDTAGLIYCATGRWLVNTISIGGLTVDMNSDSSFGMLVNKGRSGDDGLYMLLPKGYTYTISTDPFSSHSGVYDELVAFSSSDDIMKNGQGIVSIHTGNTDALIMSGSGAGNTYSAQTTVGKSKSNPNTRYYYNLDTDTRPDDKLSEIANVPQKRLMSWGLNQYACNNLKKYFGNPFSSGTITDANYDMAGYSWYPVNIDSNLTISGTFKFYNSELEKNIQGKTDTKYSSLSKTQHYLMHNALFNDVSKKLTIGKVILQGNVGVVEGVSGALVYGTVKGSSSSDDGTAEVKVSDGDSDGIILDGIHVHNFNPADQSAYAPLLINQTGDFSKLIINRVSVNNESSYKNSTVSTLKIKNNDIASGTTYAATTQPKAATSLIGNAGIDANSINISVEFTKISLDARKSGTLSTETWLNNTYHTVETLFTNSTLLNKFVYSSGSGTYKYELDEDWTGTTHTPAKVTYGSEISGGEEVDGLITRFEYIGKEFWYNNSKDEEGIGTYIHPETISTTTGDADVTTDSQGNITGYRIPYDFVGFLPYVNVKYNAENKTHQLKVNQTTSTFEGCGTYNDPYLITKGDDLKDIADTINGTGHIAYIIIPTKTEGGVTVDDISDGSSTPKTTTWHTEHAKYYFVNGAYYLNNDTSQDSVSVELVRTYMAGAYYKIDEGKTITLDSNYRGLGNLSNIEDTFAVFRGVIVGTGQETIINQSQNPLIASSYGSVVRGITLQLDVAISKSNEYAANANGLFKPDSSGCPYYGAVIGQIFGGDNIIDDVYVDYSSANFNFTVSGSNKQLIPVGGYVGVLINGGLYFRNMNMSNPFIAGLPNKNNYIKKTDGSDNMSYLYINPIIGRVMNGFAITETTVFRPFEDGTRTYSDGSKVYFDGSAFVEKDAGQTYADNKVGVTMRNGTKNYSIADINSVNADNFSMKKNNAISGDSYATISVSDAQQLYMISLITQAGLGQSNNCKYYDQYYYYKNGSWSGADYDFRIRSYKEYMTTRHASYSNIGKNASRETGSDYDISCKDTKDGGNGTIPYIIEKYSPKNTTSNNYPAFNLTNKDRYFYLELNGLSQTYYMPDGYRGIGCMLYTPTGVNQTPGSNNTNGIGKIDHASYYLYLAGFEGNGNTVSLNMHSNIYQLSNENYGFPKADNNTSLDLGFGFFDGTRCNYQNTDASKVRNVTLKGCVESSYLNTSGSKTYNSANNALGYICTGGFSGAVGSDDPNPYYFEKIFLDRLSVLGEKYAGGMVGCINTGKSSSEKGRFSTYKCGANEITVEGGDFTGGMVGVLRNGNAIFDADFGGNSFIIKSIKTAGAVGVGGLIGCVRNNQNCTIKNGTIDGAISRDENGDAQISTITGEEKRAGFVGNSSVLVNGGGIIGYIERNPQVTVQNVSVKNINMEGGYIGGCIGYIGNADASTTKIEIVDFALDSADKDSILKSTRTENNAAACGGIIGYSVAHTSNEISIKNSSVSGYSISSCRNAGGLIGYKGRKDANKAHNIIADNITISDVIIENQMYSGSLVGCLAYGSLMGYNILTNNVSFANYSNPSKTYTLNQAYNGHIVGTNTNNQIIKIAGFSRQGNGIVADMVGRYGGSAGYNYGTNGYVIFADYTGTSLDSTKNNSDFSNVRYSGTENVANVYRCKKTTANSVKVTNTVTSQVVSSDLYKAVESFYTTQSNAGKTIETTVTIEYVDMSGTTKKRTTTQIVTDGEAGTPSIVYETVSSGENTNLKTVTTTTETYLVDNEPYVTTSPKLVVSSDGKFFTGDGICNNDTSMAYSGSAVGTIISNAGDSSNYKRYQSYTLPTGTTLSSLAILLNTQKKYTTYEKARGTTSLPVDLRDFPVLVVDDISSDNTTALVNSYLRLLTNTEFDFTQDNDDIYKVRLASCLYSKTGDNYNLTCTYSPDNSSGVNLRIDSANAAFRIGGTYDNSDKNSERFTLIDIEFYDPATVSGTKKVAYHLYVPVYVKKMLYYTFDISTISGTTYRVPPYTGELRGNTIIENVGNPLTMQFRWTYQQTFREWMDLIESGENLNRNYNKQLEFTDHTNLGLPTGTKMVLVDANNNNRAYYATRSTNGLIQEDTSRGIKVLNLDKFVVNDGSDTPATFNQVDFNEFFDVYDTAPENYEDNGYVATSVTFVAESGNPTIKTNAGTGYKPGTGEGAKILYIRYKPGMYNPTDNYLFEDYYITFFTPEPDNNDNHVYHLEFTSPKTFGETAYPSNCSQRKATNIYTGVIFDNDFTVEAQNGNPEMSTGNNYIEALLTANVGVTPEAGQIIGNYLNMTTVTIFQSFLVTLNKNYYVGESETITTETGIAPKSNPLVNVVSFTVNGTSVDDIENAHSCAEMSGDNAIIDANNLELRNYVNLKTYLYNAYRAYAARKSEDPDADVTTKIPIVADVKMTYGTDDQIAVQFPQNSDPSSEKGQNIGTTISGSSNISSVVTAAAYSKTTKAGIDNTHKYYRRSSKKALLNYYSADTKTVITSAEGETPETSEEQLLSENKYEQFGVNALDPELHKIEESIIPMKTQADYNIVNLSSDAKSSIKSIKVIVSLRKKNNYTSNGNLPIDEYIVPNTLTLYGNENKSVRLTKSVTDSNAKEAVYYANITYNDFVNDNYRMPIDFSIYSGQNANFEGKTYNDGGVQHMFYSNYMLHLDVECYDEQNMLGTMVVGSDAEDHVIWTNARIYRDIIPEIAQP